MKNKASRKIVGTFAEIANLIRSLTQIMYDHIKNRQDEHFLWLIEIRRFLRYMLMPKISETQLKRIDLMLYNLINKCL